ncbi:uncharacterized protein LOC107360162 [Tetranychus urticae]|nr:uncharacterized protein LOC107360162 [Tetranychus urticae]
MLDLFQRFFAYEYLTKAFVGVPEATLLPDVSICFAIIDMINYTKLFSNYPFLLQDIGFPRGTSITADIVKSIRGEYSENDLLLFFMERLKINQIWTQMISSKSVFMKAVTYRVDELDIIEESCPFKEFFIEQAYCYSFSCSDVQSKQSHLYGLIEQYKRLNNRQIFTLSLHQPFFNTINYYWIGLTAVGTLPRGQQVKWEAQAAYKNTKRHTFFFSSIETRLLPAPYKTNCVNYTEKGFLTNTEMADACEIDLSMKQIGSPLPENLIGSPLDAHFGVPVYEHNRANSSFLQLVSDIVDHCSKITKQPNCLSVVYIPSSRTPLPIMSNYTEVTVEQVSDPIYIVELESRLTKLDVIIAIGSILGTWLGFSIVYSIPQLTGFLGIKFLRLKGTRAGNMKQKRNSTLGSDVFSTSYLNKARLYGIESWNDDYKQNKIRHFPSFYVYYNQQAWPMTYLEKHHHWWLRR